MLLAWILAIAALTWPPCASVDIVDYPRDGVWIKEGHDGVLTCTSRTRWQWCYFEITKENEHQRPPYDPTSHEGQGNGLRYSFAWGSSFRTYDEDVSFDKMTSTTCGLRLSNVQAEKFQVNALM